MPPADPIPACCGLTWGGPGGLVPGGWALKRVDTQRREDSVRAKLLAALFESQFVGTELAAWSAPIPGGPVTLTLAAWAGLLIAQRCLFLEAAEQGYVLDGPAVLALVNEIGMEEKQAPRVRVSTVKGTWDDHEPHGQVAVIYEFRDFDPVGFVRAPRLRSRALPHMPGAIPDAWKQRDPALLELDYPTEDPRTARLLRWLPGFFDDGTILAPSDPAMAEMFDRLGELHEARQQETIASAPAASPQADTVSAWTHQEPDVESETATADEPRDLNGTTSTSPPAAGAGNHGPAPVPGGVTERVSILCRGCGRSVTLNAADAAEELERCADCQAPPDKRVVTDLASESRQTSGDLFGGAPVTKTRPSRKRGTA